MKKPGPAKRLKKALRGAGGKTATRHRRTIMRLVARDGATCWLCGKSVDVRLQADHDHPMRATIDHVEPKKLGGEDELGNYRLAHKRCNGRRGHMSVEAFRARWGITVAGP